MNYGPIVFLVAFFALASSWFGLVLTPHLQLGFLQQTNTVPEAATYPLSRPGLARQGLDVYRANGCAYCHSQQVGQTGIACNVLLTDAGTNQPALIQALLGVKPGFSPAQAKLLAESLPATVLKGVTKEQADAAAKALAVDGAKANVWVVPEGPDIARGWGKRRSVAYDFLYDYPLMLGSARVGPDLADVGARLPDANWHLRHLYAPRFEIKNSVMPPYRFLFEKRKVRGARSADALDLPAGLAPEPGYEIVPRPEATALVAYLQSMRADEPLFVAPRSVVAAPSTNAPAAGAGATNAPATNAPAK